MQFGNVLTQNLVFARSFLKHVDRPHKPGVDLTNRAEEEADGHQRKEPRGTQRLSTGLHSLHNAGHDVCFPRRNQRIHSNRADHVNADDDNG